MLGFLIMLGIQAFHATVPGKPILKGGTVGNRTDEACQPLGITLEGSVG
jgi:hypothetical protein